jgi:hypothetical protein
MNRHAAKTFVSIGLLIGGIGLNPSFQVTCFAQTPDTASPSSASVHGSKSGPKLSKAQKIALAMSAGPAEITKNATLADMTEMSGGPPKELRAGTNGWVCYAVVNQPMCLDKEWQKWAAAWMSKSPLQIEGTGIAYMLKGDNGASNTDPYATAATASNEWVVSPAHLMLLLPDAKMLDAYPTDPKNGGPWVMWKGTPYAHIMVPVSATRPATMQSK